MDKTYLSNSELSIRLASGRRIMFDSVSTGGSVFRTGNIDIQAEMEQHPLFGTDFYWDGATKRNVERMEQLGNTPTHTDDESVVSPSVQPEQISETTEPEQTEEETVEIKEVEVAGIADAKEYLAENFGALRTQMRSKAQIEKIAAENNVKFVGI